MSEFTIQDVYDHLVSYCGLSYPEDAVQTFWEELNRETDPNWAELISEEAKCSLRAILGEHVVLEPVVQLESPLGRIRVEEVVRNTGDEEISWLEKFTMRINIGGRLFSCSVTRDETGIERLEDIEEIQVLSHIESQWIPMSGDENGAQENGDQNLRLAEQNILRLMLQKNPEWSEKINLAHFLADLEEPGSYLRLPDGTNVQRTQNFQIKPEDLRVRMVVSYGMQHFFEIRIPVDSYEGRYLEGIEILPVDVQDVVVITYQPISERLSLPGHHWWRRESN